MIFLRPGKRTAWSGAILVACWAALRFSPLPDNALRTDFSTLYLAQGKLLRINLNQSGRYRLKTPFSEFSPEVKKGFLAYEDRYFRWHYGINPVAVSRALFLNLSGGRIRSGASTITMQVAKLIKPRPRTIGVKIVEAIRALQLEARYSKDEIFELYLNSVPMGGNIEGVGAASWLYFGKSPSLLSVGEAALLVSLPRSPNAQRPDRSPTKARLGRDKVLDRIAARNPASARELAEAKGAEIPPRRFPNPHLAPHLLRRVDAMHNAKAQRFALSIQQGYQSICEEELRRSVAELRRHGVSNGAVILVDNHDMRVLAYVGSPDFSDQEGGQVNGADILRSPGSALKPFLYAMGLEAGIVTPGRMVYDVPRDFGGYRPVNMEGHYEGAVRSEDALIHSLNTVAVDLDQRLFSSKQGLESWLKGDAGLRGRGRQDAAAGLTAVLGGYPVTLEEGVTLYAMLAHGGRLRTLRFLDGAADPSSPEEGRRLFSEEATFLISEMLAKVQRPDLPTVWESSPTRAKVAFKTGTSFGFKDAWCLGYTPDYTLGVWLGNVNARGATVLRGAKAASPLFFQIMNRITRTKDHWFKVPQGVIRRKICGVTGEAASPWCPSTADDWAIAGVSDTLPCSVHQALWIRRSDGREVCPHCMAGDANLYTRKVYEIWPPELSRFFRSAHKGLRPLPEHNLACTFAADRQGPRIISPSGGLRYVIDPALPRESQRVPLAAQAGMDVKKLFWFDGDVLLHEGKPDETFFKSLDPGKQKLSVVDDRGRADVVEYVVEWKSDRLADKRSAVEVGE